LAPNGHGRMSDLSPLSGEERKSNFPTAMSESDPTATLAAHCDMALMPSQPLSKDAIEP
jgi:hypothetical protein